MADDQAMNDSEAVESAVATVLHVTPVSRALREVAAALDLQGSFNDLAVENAFRRMAAHLRCRATEVERE